MEDFDKTIPPMRAPEKADFDERTIPGRRDRKSDGRFNIGELIMGRYKILAELGQGGMGIVYKCFDETAGIEAALKALPPELSHNSFEMEDIRENFQLVSKLVHQNIAISRNLEKDPADGSCYLIMECVEGEDLRRWIKRRRKEGNLTPPDVLPIISQVADALDYAHKQKIIHRDIKPGNIMINSAGEIKVLDFGLAAQLHTSMSRISMAYHGTSGTGPYMAPEQWRGRAQGAAADQYALAVMTYEMLAGHLPFENADPAVLQQAVLTQEPEDIPDIPEYMQRAIFRAMSKEPHDRFKSCSDFVAALHGRGTNSAKSNSGKWFIILLTVVFICGLGCFFINRWHQERESARLKKIEQEKIEAAAREAQEKKDAAARKKQKDMEDERLRKLDRANSELKIELDKKISLLGQEEKNYRPAEFFSGKISKLKESSAIIAGMSLLDEKNKCLHNALKTADDILRDGALSKSIFELKNKIADKRRENEKYQPQIYAKTLYDQAILKYQNAEKNYGELKFAEAENGYRNSLAEFEKAFSVAFEEKLEFLNKKAAAAKDKRKWDELESAAKEILVFDRKKAAELTALAAEGKRLDKCNAALDSARKAESEKNWDAVKLHALAVLKLDCNNLAAQELIAKAENKLSPKLVVTAYVEGRKVTPQLHALKTTLMQGSKMRKGKEYAFVVEYISNGARYCGKIAPFVCPAGDDQHKEVTLQLVPFPENIILSGGIVLETVKIKAGTFIMGSPQSEIYRLNGEREHKVTLTKDFYIGKFEVTQAQYKAVTGKNPARNFGDDRPVEWVTWDEAKEFCNKLNALYADKLPEGCKFDLPTEAQWEYACRAGSSAELNNGKKLTATQKLCPNLDEVGWYNKNSADGKHKAVGGRRANAWGVFDMHGNVAEWCRDRYDTYPAVENSTDPVGPSSGSCRVVRGGGTESNSAENCRSAYRTGEAPHCKYGNLGFRIAIVSDTERVENKVRTEVKTAVRTEEIVFDRVSCCGVALEMVKIKAGSFIMGSPESESGRERNEKQHRVTLSRDFWIGRYEVTQAQYKAVMGRNPSHYSGYNRPVDMVSWNDAKEFCKKLNEYYSGRLPEGYEFDLPSEAQWEYACRAGSLTALNNNCDLMSKHDSCYNLDKVGYYASNSFHRGHGDIGGKFPNAWGIYDMHGNVAEWCCDTYIRDLEDAVDPVGNAESSNCVVRGGSWNDSPVNCRSAARDFRKKSACGSDLGFRLALVPEK